MDQRYTSVFKKKNNFYIELRFRKPTNAGSVYGFNFLNLNDRMVNTV